MIDRVLCIRKNTLKNILIVLVWFTPYFMYAYIPSGRDMFVVLRLFGNMLLIYNTGIFRNVKQPVMWLLVGYLLCSVYGMVFVSSITLGKVVRFFEFATFIFATLGLLSYDKKSRIDFLTTLQNVGVIYSVLNLLIPGNKTISGYGGEYFFLGAEANSVQLIAMLLVVSTYIDFDNRRRIGIKSIIITVTGFIFAMQNESGQGRVMIAVFVILLLFNKFSAGKLPKIIKPVLCIIGFITINIITITLSFQNWTVAKYIIEDLLHKDMTLTGREYIFTQCIPIFLEHPLLGYGYESSVVNDRLSSVFIGFNSAHNAFLQILIDNGLVGMILFVIIIYMAFRSAYEKRCGEMIIVYFGMIALIMGGLVNSVLQSKYFWLLMAFAISQRKVELLE